MMSIIIETERKVLSGELIDLAELNRMAISRCNGLKYLMNVMDVDGLGVYMWFVDDGENYFVDIT